jgi:acyl carrier protein
MNVKNEVIAFLEASNTIPGDTEAEKLQCRYLEAGVIDSMGIVVMITEFEEKFGIRFNGDHLQSDQFLTVGGVIGLIEELRRAAS